MLIAFDRTIRPRHRADALPSSRRRSTRAAIFAIHLDGDGAGLRDQAAGACIVASNMPPRMRWICGALERSPEESVKTSKVVPIRSLTQKAPLSMTFETAACAFYFTNAK